MPRCRRARTSSASCAGARAPSAMCTTATTTSWRVRRASLWRCLLCMPHRRRMMCLHLVSPWPRWNLTPVHSTPGLPTTAAADALAPPTVLYARCARRALPARALAVRGRRLPGQEVHRLHQRAGAAAALRARARRQHDARGEAAGAHHPHQPAGVPAVLNMAATRVCRAHV